MRSRSCLVLAGCFLLLGLGCDKVRDKAAAESEKASAKNDLPPGAASTFTVHADDGGALFTVQTRLPATFPRDVPMYPGAKVTQVTDSPESFQVTLESKDPVAKVAAFYKANAKPGKLLAAADEATNQSFQYSNAANREVLATVSRETGEPVTTATLIVRRAITPPEK